MDEIINFADLGIMLVSALFKIFLASIAFVGVRFALNQMDRALGVDEIKDWIESADYQTKAIYYGLRLVGVCVLFGSVF